ncbi:MAG TPA: polysaccharide deacetylase family protein [Candidatus Saccharimonadales bacterium]|nr:polysaccharide deacetylase family protein [Candidatus Saccharimonadales bacterium]
MSINTPLVTVIILARNEEAYLTKTIQAVHAQDYAGKIEVLVINNASVDKTDEVARKAGAKVIYEGRVGMPQGRETGRLAAKGEIIVYVDADTLLPPHYVSTMVRTFEERPRTVAVSNPFHFYDAAGNRSHRWLTAFFFGLIYPLESILLHLMGRSNQVLGANFAVRSEALEKVHGFDTSITFSGEDLAISKRLSTVGTITILPHLYTETSDRRFAAYGTVRTFLSYGKNFFSVLFLNHASDGSILRKLLKFVVLVGVILLGVKYLHVMRFVKHDLDRSFGYVGIAVAAMWLYATFYPRSSLFGRTTFRFNSTEKLVALTFDDGPNTITTPQVLDILKKERVTATFFVTGKHAEEHPEMLARIVTAGHELGNHSYNHRFLLPFMPTASIRTQLDRTQAAINATPHVDRVQKQLFRPPHGWRSIWMMAELRRQNYEVVTWDVGIDYIPGVSVKRLVKHYVDKTKPGSILLMHDVLWEKPNGDRDKLVTALPQIIAQLRAKGYRFVKVRDML